MSLAALGRIMDLGFLALLEVWAQLDVWAPQITAPNHMVGDKPVLSAAALAAGLGLLGRSRWPLVTTAVVLGSFLIPMLLYGSSLGLGWFLLIGLALYSVGAHAALRPAIILRLPGASVGHRHRGAIKSSTTPPVLCGSGARTTSMD